MSYDSPFSGIRVIDLSQGIAGPYCAMLLAQWGANVIKIEPPDGDWSRSLGPRYGDHTAFSIAGNLGKRSLAIDLKRAEGRAVLERLVAGANVFMEGFRPGVIARLGFGFERVSQLAPGIIYLSISGFGQTGPMRESPAMDPILQAYAGFMANNKDGNGQPQRAGPIIVDMTTALYAYQAVAAGLYAQRDEPKPRYIDASLMAGAANLQVVRMMSTDLEGREPQPGFSPGGVFPCHESHIQILVQREKNWQDLCDILGRPALKDDPRFNSNANRAANIEELNVLMREALAAKRAEEWSALLTEAGIQNGQVLDYLEFLQQPQVHETGLISRLPQPGLPKPVAVTNPPGHAPLTAEDPRAVAPPIGSHSRAVLLESGFSNDEVTALLEQEIVLDRSEG